jgi:hypothetical protein
MLDPKKREGYNTGDRRFLEIVDEFGWHVMNVAPRVDSKDKKEWFSYSTGLFRAFGHPEILLCGLDSSTAHRVINDIGKEVKAGRTFEIETSYDGIFADGVRCQFQSVNKGNYADYVGWAMWFYEGSEFPVWQCFWPDRSGLYPWEKECDPFVVEVQPQLYKFQGTIM